MLLLAVAMGCGPGGCETARDGGDAPPPKKNGAVTVEYIAHACFRVTSPAGKQILIDPYASRVWLGYDFPPNIRADAVLISHPHYDHDGGEAMHRRVPWPTNTFVFRTPGTNRIGDVTVIGIPGKHADPWGKEFGQSNTIWLLEVGGTKSTNPPSFGTKSGPLQTRLSRDDEPRGLRIVHLGDNGPLRDDIIRRLGRVDVLMMPIDSQFHILHADQIAAIRQQLSPSILIPMHYRHHDLEPSAEKPEQLGGIEEWAKREDHLHYLDTNEREFSVEKLPKKQEIIIFRHSSLVKAPRKTKEE